MDYKRWYDKYPDLQSLLRLLSAFNDEQINAIADDFIQVAMNKYGNRFDEIIQLLDKAAPDSYDRWYDKNYNLHTCIEFIRMLEEPEKKEITDLFIMSVSGFVTNNENR